MELYHINTSVPTFFLHNSHDIFLPKLAGFCGYIMSNFYLKMPHK